MFRLMSFRLRATLRTHVDLLDNTARFRKNLKFLPYSSTVTHVTGLQPVHNSQFATASSQQPVRNSQFATASSQPLLRDRFLFYGKGQKLLLYLIKSF